ncbi:MAG: hypothetical protein AABX59_03975, partial [Nanoarchaeota archaeon]
DVTKGPRIQQLPNIDSYFRRGSSGILYLEADAPSTTYANSKEEDRIIAEANADTEYRKVFGAFYVGTDEDEFILRNV